MIHVCFQPADKQVLEQVLTLDESLAGDIKVIADDYAVGPLLYLDTPDGWQMRRNWWTELLQQSGDYNVDEALSMVDDKLVVHHIKKALDDNPEEIVWIWAAQNKHDVSGYYWLLSQLGKYEGRIYIIYLNNLPFINDKGGIFYPVWLFEIQPKEFLKAKKLARLVTPAEFEIDTDEWRRVCDAGKIVRLLEGGKKLGQANEDFYDKALSKYVTGDFQKANRIIQSFLSKEKEITGDVYLIWRLKKLIKDNEWEVRGDINLTTRDYDIKNPNLPSLRKKKSDTETDTETE